MKELRESKKPFQTSRERMQTPSDLIQIGLRSPDPPDHLHLNEKLADDPGRPLTIRPPSSVLLGPQHDHRCDIIP